MGSKIIVALDYSKAESALEFIDKVTPDICRLKIGKEMFTRLGPVFVEKVVAKGFDVFLDLKYHDIPNTVAAACEAASDLGVWMTNVHAHGGRRMMEAAREGVERSGHNTLLIAVTVLTSLSQDDLKEIGLNATPAEQVVRLAELTAQSGLNGVVCSPLEINLLREKHGNDFALVTPGIRPAGSGADDQRRTLTPSEAIQNGASYLVIGRPITQAIDPVGQMLTIKADIDRLVG